MHSNNPILGIWLAGIACGMICASATALLGGGILLILLTHAVGGVLGMIATGMLITEGCNQRPIDSQPLSHGGPL